MPSAYQGLVLLDYIMSNLLLKKVNIFAHIIHPSIHSL